MNQTAFEYGIEKYCLDRGLDAEDLAVLLKMAAKVGLDKDAGWGRNLVEGIGNVAGAIFPPARIPAFAASVGSGVAGAAMEHGAQQDAQNAEDMRMKRWAAKNPQAREGLSKAKTWQEKYKVLQQNNGGNAPVGATGTAGTPAAPGVAAPGASTPLNGNSDDPDAVIAQYHSKFGPYERKQNQSAVAMKFLQLSNQMGLDPNDPASGQIALERFRARYGDNALTNLQTAAKQNKAWFKGHVDPSTVQIATARGRKPQLMGGNAPQAAQAPQAPQSPQAPQVPEQTSSSGPAAYAGNAGTPGFNGYGSPAAPAPAASKGPKLSGQSSFGQPTLTNATAGNQFVQPSAMAQAPNSPPNKLGGPAAPAGPAVGAAAAKDQGPAAGGVNFDAMGRQLTRGQPVWIGGKKINPNSPEASQYTSVFQNSPSGKQFQQNQQSTGYRAASQAGAAKREQARMSDPTAKAPGIYSNMESPMATDSLRNLDMDRVANKGNYKPTGQLPVMTGKPPADTAAARAMSSGQPAFTAATPAAPVTKPGMGLSEAGDATSKKPALDAELQGANDQDNTRIRL